MKLNWSKLSLFVAVCASSASSIAQPMLDHTSPAAISSKGGQITLHGSGLNQPLSLWCTPGAEAIFSAASADSAVCRITFPTPADGIAALRVATRSGISSPLLIAIDELPTVTANGKNKSIKQAQAIELPVAIEGAAEELTSHFYKFSGHKGETLSVDIVASRIGSRLDPLVRLLDATGKELVYRDDDPAIAPDSRFDFTFPADGTYILEIRDAAYEGSSQHRYRMRVGEMGIGLTPDRPVPAQREKLPQISEKEPNDQPSLAAAFTIPSRIKGGFDKAHDRDIYRFSAKMGDHVLVRSKTRSLGFPCDLFVRIAKANGTKLADSKSDVPDEASVDATIPQDGNYLLIVEELTGQGGEQMHYQLTVEPFAGFSLATETEKLDIPAGGQAEMKITATRRDYKGPITLALESGPDGIRLINDTIKEGQNDLQLKIKLPTDAPVGRALNFRLVGKAKINNDDCSQPLSTMPALKKLFPMLRYPPTELDGEIGLGVKPLLPTTTTAPTTKPK
jgi:hypothetical protein